MPHFVRPDMRSVKDCVENGGPSVAGEGKTSLLNTTTYFLLTEHQLFSRHTAAHAFETFKVILRCVVFMTSQ